MKNQETAQTDSQRPIRVIDALPGQLLIRSVDGSEVTLKGYRIGTHYCSTTARLKMAKETQWDVPEVDAPQAEGRFSRDTEVCVGEPFGMLFYYPEHDRRVWITLGRVETVHPNPYSHKVA